MMRVVKLLLLSAMFMFFGCTDDDEGQLDGFYKGTLTAEVETINVFYGDTVIEYHTKVENFDLRIKGDRYFTRNRKGDFFILNEDQLLFVLEVNNCFFGCEAILNDTVNYQTEAHVLVMEDEIKYTTFYFNQQFVTEERVFSLTRN